MKTAGSLLAVATRRLVAQGGKWWLGTGGVAGKDCGEVSDGGVGEGERVCEVTRGTYVERTPSPLFFSYFLMGET